MPSITVAAFDSTASNPAVIQAITNIYNICENYKVCGEVKSISSSGLNLLPLIIWTHCTYLLNGILRATYCSLLILTICSLYTMSCFTLGRSAAHDSWSFAASRSSIHFINLQGFFKFASITPGVLRSDVGSIQQCINTPSLHSFQQCTLVMMMIGANECDAAFALAFFLLL